MNKVVLIGNITREVELRYSQGGKAIASFTLAVKREYGDNETDFLPIVAWQKQAESCANYLQKGSKVAVDGRIQTRSYEAKDGSKRYVTEIIADRVEFLDSKPKSFGTEVPFTDEDNPFVENEK